MVLFLSYTRYVLDSNVFINMQRHYPVDVFSSLWDIFGEIIDRGDAISCVEVFDELSIGNDYLIQWAKQRKDAFIFCDRNIQFTVRAILEKYPDLITSTRKANNADPFVVSVAKIKGYTLVSDETYAGNGQPVKIPNICKAYGVRLLTFIEFLRENKIQI